MDKLSKVFEAVQQSKASHEKYYFHVCELYKKTPVKEFYESYLNILKLIFNQELHKNRSPMLENCFNFFVNAAVRIHELPNNDGSKATNNLFLTKIIRFVLEFYNNILIKFRFASCKYIANLLDSIKDDVEFSDAIYELIEKTMIKRLKDKNVAVRIEAVKAVHRLQVPTRDDCVIVHELLKSLTDGNALVRKEVIHKLAPCSASIPEIINCVRDIDYRVRQVVFWKCSVISPTYFKIIDRCNILKSGFSEEHHIVKKTFLEVMFPKWLTCYKRNFLQLVAAIQLDADENDIETSAMISKDIMQTFFKYYSIKDIIDNLPIDDNKLIPIEKLSNDTMSYWSLLQGELNNLETENLLDSIVPELTIFCEYIQRVIIEKRSTNVEHWQELEYKFVVMKLFEMAACYDLSDEAGRQCLHLLIITNLTQQKLDITIIQKMIEILNTLSANVDTLIGEVHDIICNIKEPMVDAIPTADEVREKNFKIAELRVKINILSEEFEDAIRNRELDVAMQKEKEMKELIKVKTELEEGDSVDKVKNVKTDSETLIRCIDITIALLSLHNVVKLTETLKEIIEDLRDIAMTSLNWDNRILKLHVLASLIDKDMAMENLLLFITPIYIYYVSSSGTDSEDIVYLIKSVCDLICIYGPTLFGTLDPDNNPMHREPRRTYQRGDSIDSLDLDEICTEDIIELIFRLKNDKCDKIRESVGIVLSQFLYEGTIVTSNMIVQILLIWCTPLTENNHSNMHQSISMSLSHYSQQIGGSDVIKMAIVPLIKELLSVPKNSPLANVNLDNVVDILVYLTSSKQNKGEDVHQSLAFILCDEMLKDPFDKSTVLFIKMLVSLNLPISNKERVTELISKMDLILEVISDKQCIQKIMKFKVVLMQAMESIENEMIIDDDREKEDEGDASRKTDIVVSLITPPIDLVEEAQKEENISTNVIVVESPIKKSETNVNVENIIQEFSTDIIEDDQRLVEGFKNISVSGIDESVEEIEEIIIEESPTEVVSKTTTNNVVLGTTAFTANNLTELDNQIKSYTNLGSEDMFSIDENIINSSSDDYEIKLSQLGQSKIETTEKGHSDSGSNDSRKRKRS